MESQAKNKNESKESIGIKELENRIVKLEVDFKNRIDQLEIILTQLENRAARFEKFMRIGF